MIDSDTMPREVASMDLSAPVDPDELVIDTSTEASPEDLELVAKLGLDRIPTAEEAKALLAARRAEIRHAVLVQADKRAWCEDGTRKVCANLRLERPGARTEKMVEVEMVLKVKVPVQAYTDEGALQNVVKQGVLSTASITNRLYVRSAEIAPVAVAVDGNPVDVSTLILDEKKPEVTA